MKHDAGLPVTDRHTPLALRKQLLILRAQVQREELALQLRAWRAAGASPSAWLGAALRPTNLQRLGRVWSLVRQSRSWAPALGSAASWGLSRWRWPAFRHAGLALSLGWLLWQGWRLVRDHQKTGHTEAQAAAPSAHSVEGSSTTAERAKPTRPSRPRSGASPQALAVSEQELSIARRLAELARRLDAGR